MAFISWSDSAGVFDLLVDYVVDEISDCDGDPERLRFLQALLARLREVESLFPEAPEASVIAALKRIPSAIGGEFGADRAVLHLRDCIEELEQIAGAARTALAAETRRAR